MSDRSGCRGVASGRDWLGNRSGRREGKSGWQGRGRVDGRGRVVERRGETKNGRGEGRERNKW